MTDTHKCPCGCGEDIPYTLLSCRRSWFALPKDIRTMVWRAYRDHGIGSPQHNHAVQHALDAMKR